MVLLHYYYIIPMVLYYCSSIRSSIATTSAKIFPFHDPSQRSDIFWPELSAGRKDEEKKKKKKKKKDVGNEVGGPSEWCECMWMWILRYLHMISIDF